MWHDVSQKRRCLVIYLSIWYVWDFFVLAKGSHPWNNASTFLLSLFWIDTKSLYLSLVFQRNRSVNSRMHNPSWHSFIIDTFAFYSNIGESLKNLLSSKLFVIISSSKPQILFCELKNRSNYSSLDEYGLLDLSTFIIFSSLR